MNRIGEAIFSAIYPPKCILCSKLGSYTCDYCCGKYLLQKKSQSCFLCGKYSPAGITCGKCITAKLPDQVIVTTKQTRLTSKLIHELKYNFYSYFAELIAKQMLFNQDLTDILHSNVLITCIPIHNSRKRWRGFNQSEIIAKQIAQETNKRYLALIIKSKKTSPQVGLDKKQRQSNVKDSFQIKDIKDLKNTPQNILIIDDILTTGATIIESSKTLRNAGYKGRICVAVFTRGT